MKDNDISIDYAMDALDSLAAKEEATNPIETKPSASNAILFLFFTSVSYFLKISIISCSISAKLLTSYAFFIIITKSIDLE